MRLWMTALLLFAACPKRPVEVPPLEGTVWRLDTNLPDLGPTSYAVRLDPDGHLTSYSPRDNTPENDSWSVSDGQLILSINDGFVVYTASFVDPQHASGEAQNARSGSWSFTLTREE